MGDCLEFIRGGGGAGEICLQETPRLSSSNSEHLQEIGTNVGVVGLLQATH